ncbi:glycosyltransferase family 4 protein [Mucilaginibacter lutimaris]|uniref:Glycosyltransferase family 4 protein n=1 Tax=Mucilaginibacter lutimaris TaxID=931629 RepID=A0ABW2ZGY2_9SPHI
MNVALITPYFPDERTLDSGIANHYQLLAQNLAAAGHHIVVVHVRPSYEHEQDTFSKHSPASQITVLTFKVRVPAIINRLFKNQWAIVDMVLKLRCMLVTAGAIRGIIKEYHIQIIETSSYFSLCYFLSHKKIRIPLVVRVSTTFSQMLTGHYPFKSRGMDLIAAMEIAFIKKSRQLITHAKSHAIELEKLYGLDARSFRIIAHGISIPTLKTRSGSDVTRVKVLYVGRLEYRKGTDVLLSAIPLVLQQCPHVFFELIGNDPGNQNQREFEQKNETDILARVSFRGRIDLTSLTNAYQSCDIFVAPSRYESFGLIFIEAMSFAKPAIGCAVGGVPDIIIDHYNGLFARPGDAQNLADMVIRLAKNESLRKVMGSNARKTVEERFSGKKLAADSIHYYQTLLVNT